MGGLANLFYWIDCQNGGGGFWATQILPFADPVSFGGCMEFETAVYSGLESAAPPPCRPGGTSGKIV